VVHDVARDQDLRVYGAFVLELNAASDDGTRSSGSLDTDGVTLDKTGVCLEKLGLSKLFPGFRFTTIYCLRQETC